MTHKQAVKKIVNEHYDKILDYFDPSRGRGRALKQELTLAVMDGRILGMQQATEIVKGKPDEH